ILSCCASVLWRSVGSTRVVALKGCLPLAEADSYGADSAVVVGVRVGGVVEEAESPFFFLALARCCLSHSTCIVLLVSLTVPYFSRCELNW
nr:hypothetical protein [Tanacetum cinerariifolium]